MTEFRDNAQHADSFNMEISTSNVKKSAVIDTYAARKPSTTSGMQLSKQKSRLKTLAEKQESPEEIITNLAWDGDFKGDVSLKTLLAKLDKGISRRRR